MLRQATVDKMNAMKMFGLVEAFERQLTSAQMSELSFEERVGMLIDAEFAGREQRQLARRLLSARLRHQASLEQVDLKAHRGLDRQVVLSLGERSVTPTLPSWAGTRHPCPHGTQTGSRADEEAAGQAQAPRLELARVVAAMRAAGVEAAVVAQTPVEE